MENLRMTRVVLEVKEESLDALLRPYLEKGGGDLVERMTAVQVAVGVRRAVMQGEDIPRVLPGERLIHPLPCPEFLQLGLPLLAIGPHVELGLWQVHCVLVWACQQVEGLSFEKSAGMTCCRVESTRGEKKGGGG